MATLEKSICKNLFDSVLPVFGTPREHIPVWNEGQKMFIFEEHEALSGNRYYRGVRFCERLAIVEKVGMFHSWTYIDSIELYAFNGKKLELVQKQDYEKTFRNEDFVRKESERMVKEFLQSVVKMHGEQVSDALLEAHAKKLVEQCFRSYLEKDFCDRLTQIIPIIENQ